MNVLIKIYDCFRAHKAVPYILLVVLAGLLSWAASRLHFTEDIFDFLPQDQEYTESMQVYASLSEASRIVVIFEGDDPDSICMAIDAFGEEYEEAVTEVDLDAFLDRLDYVYKHMPYFLSEADYDTLELRMREAERWIARDKQWLSMPGSSFLSNSIASDPLQLIPLTRGAGGQYAGAQSAFDSYDGYMMTRDHRMGFAFYDSPYGSTESGRNGALIDSLQTTLNSLMQRYPSVGMRLIGSPVVAVGNARRIKLDSMIAIGVSMVLITLLLLYAFPRRRDIGLIILAIGFGWLTGMAALGMTGQAVSVIVLGIGAILIGIAVNYPLHILVHRRYTATVRQALVEVLSPLVVGNVTTIGAFAALIPLGSPALRQLGIFASALLIGTIVFCVLFLPHMMAEEPTEVRDIRWINKDTSTRFKTISLIGLLLVAGAIWWSVPPTPLFDPNLSHLNYMTKQQRADFAYFEALSPVSDEKAYLSGSAKEELEKRTAMWQTFWNEHSADSLAEVLENEGVKVGFRPNAFEPFIRTITGEYEEADINEAETLAALWPGRFDSQALNERVTLALSEDFDYLGLVCAMIVFVFLCLSFRSITLAAIAFLPMMLSWVLIFALMRLTGLQFNIVNVILATFIFGQGDDYTIFILEGLLYEQRTGQKMLPQYRQSIILSAMIMLIAIGVLVFAQHPAMHSLGTLTLIGMSCVLVMAWLVPPVVLKGITNYKLRIKN